MAQSSSEKIKLCFIKNPQHNITAVEAFLKKRGYDVQVFTQTEKGMNYIEHNDPQFIFLAWDHIDETMRMLPQMLYQFATGAIIPFTFSTQRDQIFQLETSGFEHKLYPPLSGPAILRLVAKIEKQNQDLTGLTPKEKNAAPKESSMIQVKSFFKDEDKKKESLYPKLSDAELNQLAQKNKSRATTFLKNSDPTDDSLSFSKNEKKLDQIQSKSLDENYFKEVRKKLSDLKEKTLDQDGYNDTVKYASHLFTLIVQEPEWTGYLCIATESYIDIEEIRPILHEWVQKMIHDSASETGELTEKLEIETPLFEIRMSPVDFVDLCHKKSDFFKEIVVGNKTTFMGYFPFSPFHVINNMHSELKYLDLPVEYLKSEIEIPFDVFLYLSENNKMLLYIKRFNTIEDSKIIKLQDRKIESVYTPLEFNDILMQYKANINLNELIEAYYLANL